MTALTRSLASFGSLLVSLAFGWGPVSIPARAAEILTLRLGIFEQTVRVDRLESYARTGEIPPELRPYRGLLTPDVRDLLGKSIRVDRKLAGQFLENLFRGEDGERLLAQFNTLIPASDPESVRETCLKTLRDGDKIDVFNWLKAYPGERVTLDLLALASIVVRLGEENIENTWIGSELTRSSRSTRETPLPEFPAPHLRGNRVVFTRERVFDDPSRKRAIKVDLYYSTRKSERLVVMSHGFAADRRFLRYLAYHLASHGLTVVSVEHPGSNIDALARGTLGLKPSELLPAGEFVDRPKDISFVLDELARLNREENDFQGRLPEGRVTIIGHSFGGYTALALAGARLTPGSARAACSRLTPLERSPADWLQCSAAELPYTSMSFRDHRIERAIVLNPIVGALFARDLSSVSIPTLVLTSTADGITPIVENQLQPFARLGGAKYLLVADGATHMSVTDPSYLDSPMGRSTLAREVMDERADALRKAIEGIALAFIQQSTPESELYRPFLAPTYVESFSTDHTRFRLIRQIPGSIATALSLLSFARSPVRSEPPPPLPSWLETSWGIFYGWFAPPDFRTVKLNAIFGELLRHSERAGGSPGEPAFNPWG